MPLQILAPLHTHPDGNSPGLAKHLGAVAAHLGAEVNALVLNPAFPPTHSPFVDAVIDVPGMIAKATAQSKNNEKALLAAIRSVMDQREISLRISQADYFPAELTGIVTQAARYHDLSILGIGDHEARLRDTAEEVLFGAGRPVLLVPEDLEAGGKFEHVAIAWDGSRVAARAVGDAGPFLERATSITVLCVDDEKPLPGPDIGRRLADQLARHGYSVHADTIQTKGQPIAHRLQERALEIGAGMLVMGGFGHSRMRDFILGGATGGILRNPRLPVLLSH